MHTRDLVKKIFANEGLYRSSDPKMKALLAAIDEQPMDCWPEFVARFRKDYYELFDRVVPPLINSGDQLITAVVLHHADLKQPKERALIKKYVQNADERAHEGVLKQVARLGDAELDRELAKKALTPNVQAVLTRRTPLRKTGASNVTKAQKQGTGTPKTAKRPQQRSAGRRRAGNAKR